MRFYYTDIGLFGLDPSGEKGHAPTSVSALALGPEVTNDLHRFCRFTGKLDIPRHIVVLLKQGKQTSTVVCGSVLLNERVPKVSQNRANHWYPGYTQQLYGKASSTSSTPRLECRRLHKAPQGTDHISKLYLGGR